MSDGGRRRRYNPSSKWREIAPRPSQSESSQQAQRPSPEHPNAANHHQNEHSFLQLIGGERIQHNRPRDPQKEGNIKDKATRIAQAWHGSHTKQMMQHTLRNSEYAGAAVSNVVWLGPGSLSQTHGYDSDDSEHDLETKGFSDTSIQLSVLPSLIQWAKHSHSVFYNVLHRYKVYAQYVAPPPRKTDSQYSEPDFRPTHDAADLNVLNDRGIRASFRDAENPVQRIRHDTMLIMYRLPSYALPNLSHVNAVDRPAVIVTIWSDYVQRLGNYQHVYTFQWAHDDTSMEEADEILASALNGVGIWVRADLVQTGGGNGKAAVEYQQSPSQEGHGRGYGVQGSSQQA
ncbi:MAG: hypothetical protein Q9159_006595 [Coniocarpon cinnabarinum]